MHFVLSVLMTFMAAATPTREQMKANFDAHQADFDYLLGDWEFTANNQQWGKSNGFWSAVRIDGGQILDEYRIVGDNGETYYVTRTLRTYNAALNQWELVSTGQGAGLQDVGTGRREGAEVRIEQKFGYGTPTPSIWRIRYYDIKPDGFSWAADRSADDGKTWTKNFQTIEAHRIGPARSMEPIARARKRSSQ